METHNTSASALGNVLGTDGVVYCEDDPVGCFGADPAAALPPSLYLAEKPDWFGDVPWPPVDPDGPTVHDLPAKLAFEAK